MGEGNGPRTARSIVSARRRGAVLAGSLLAAATFVAGALVGTSTGGSAASPNRVAPPPVRPAGPAGNEARVARATAWAAGRTGRVAFAVTRPDGRLRGVRAGERFVTASVVKVMLLVAELERLERVGAPLTRALRAQLRLMVAESDNDAATAVYRRVGDRGLRSLARRSRLRDFLLGPRAVASCRCRGRGWARAQISARDQARFMQVFPDMVPGRRLGFAKATLAGIAPDGRWGIVQEAPSGWRALFKSGIRETGLGTLVHQVARLEAGEDTVSVAVLTDGNPDEAYGKETVRGVLRALVGGGAP
jgi:beta-lactamase class A